MIAVKFRSPFLLLLTAIAVWSCADKSDAGDVVSPEFEQYISIARDTIQSATIRLGQSSKAYNYALRQKDPYLLLEAYNAKSDILQHHYPDSVSAFLDDYTKASLGRNDAANLANAYYKKGHEYAGRNMADSSFRYYAASKQKYGLVHDSLQMAEKLIFMGNIYWTYNDFIELESTGTEILGLLGKSFDPGVDTAYAAIAYNFYGLAYTGRNEYGNALESYRQALKLAKDSVSINTIRNNTAWVMMESGDYAKAIPILEKLRRSNALENDSVTLAKVLDNLGYSLFKNDGKEGLSHLVKSLEIRVKTDDRFGQVPSYLHLSEYFKNSNPTLARKHAAKAYSIATSLSSPNDRLAALKALRKISSGRELEHFSELHIKIGDSVEKVRQRAKNQFAKIRYDYGQKNAENLSLKAQNAQKALEMEQAHNRNRILALSLLCAALAIAVVYLFMRKKLKEDKILEARKAEGNMAKKVHDELANDLYNVLTFAETQDLSKSERKETLLETLDNVYSRTRDIARESNPVDTGEHYPTQLREMLSGYGNSDCAVITQGIDSIPWLGISDTKKYFTWRILQELMVNMKKHSGAHAVAVRFEFADNSVRIIYSDNGIGMGEENKKYKNGLRNVENRIDAIGGSISFGPGRINGLIVSMSYSVKN